MKKKVIIYGTGKNCDNLMLNAIINDIEIVTFVDKNKAGLLYKDKMVDTPHMINNYLFDEVWITNADYQEIKEYLIIEEKIPDGNIKVVKDINRSCLEFGIQNNKYVMLTNNIDYLNYPYLSLAEEGALSIIYLLHQKEMWNTELIECLEEKIFIIRSHIVGEIWRNSMLMLLKKHFQNSKLVLVLSDMVYGRNGYASKDVLWNDFNNIKQLFFLVITYHSLEADKLNLYYMSQPYPSKFRLARNISNDGFVFFVGNAKDRLHLLYKIYEKLTDAGIMCKFWICDVDEKAIRHDYNGIVFNTKLTYAEYLKIVERCGCILELSYSGNETSMRYVEAVILNKKLLIYKQDLKNRPFYSPDYMKEFDDKLSFDYDWITEDEEVNYYYNNMFDPVHLLELIEQRLINF